MTTLLDVQDLTVRFALPRPRMFAPRPHLEACAQSPLPWKKAAPLASSAKADQAKQPPRWRQSG